MDAQAIAMVRILMSRHLPPMIDFAVVNGIDGFMGRRALAA
jgi:hypothetical protein